MLHIVQILVVLVDNCR